MRHHLLSIRTRLVLVIIAVFVPLFVFATLLAVDYASAQREMVVAERVDAANKLALIIDHELTTLKKLLLDLARSPEIQAKNFAAFKQSAKLALATGDFAEISLLDAHDHPLVSAVTSKATAVENAIPTPLLESVLGGNAAVSDLLEGDGEQNHSFEILVPVPPAGDAKYVLGARISLDTWSELFNEIGLKPGWFAAIVDRNGTIVARNRDAANLVGKLAAPDAVAAAEGATLGGSFEAVSHEGVKVSSSYQKSLVSGWTAVVAVPRDILNAPMHRSLIAISVLGAGLISFGVGLASLIAKRISSQIRNLSTFAVALVEGDPLPPLEDQTTEFFEVANAFRYAETIVLARKASEASVRENERQLRLVLDSLVSFVGVLDPDGTLIEVNAAPLHAAGLTRDDVLGKRFWDCHWWSYSKAVQIQLQEDIQRAKQGHIVRRDVDVLVKDGTFITIDFQLAPIIVDGQLVHIVPSGLDISERKKTEREMSESEARFRGIFENAGIGAARVGLDGRWINVNDRLCQILGYSREELLDLSFKDITHPDDLNEDLTHRQALLQGEVSSYTMTKRYVRKDGVNIWVELTTSLVKNANGAPQYVIAVLSDITERKMAEQTLRASEARLRRLQDSNIIAIVTSDEERIIEANKFFLDMTGYTEAELAAGRVSWRSITPPEFADMDARALNQLKTSGSAEPYEKEYIHKDGRRVPILFGAATLETNPARFICFIVDLTDRKQAENHIRFLMRELSHRSKNLLAVIQAMASQTARSAQSIEEFQKRFSQRIQGLAASHDLLAHQNWHGVSVAELVRRQLAPFVDNSDPRVKISGPQVTFTAEAGQNLGLALHELATNAVKYGALSVHTGEISIAWHILYNGGQPDRFRMSWVERGGPQVAPPTRKGFGHTVIDRMLSAALDGTVKLDFPPEGVTWNLDVPIVGVTKILTVEDACQAA